MTEYSQYSQLLTDTYLAYDGVLIDRLADHARPLLQLDNLDPLELLELRHVELVDDLQPPPSVPKCDCPRPNSFRKPVLGPAVFHERHGALCAADRIGSDRLPPSACPGDALRAAPALPCRTACRHSMGPSGAAGVRHCHASLRRDAARASAMPTDGRTARTGASKGPEGHGPARRSSSGTSWKSAQ